MKYKLYLLGLLSLMTACKHHEIQPESVLPAPAVQTELDTWLEEHISRPIKLRLFIVGIRTMLLKLVSFIHHKQLKCVLSWKL